MLTWACYLYMNPAHKQMHGLHSKVSWFYCENIRINMVKNRRKIVHIAYRAGGKVAANNLTKLIGRRFALGCCSDWLFMWSRVSVWFRLSRWPLACMLHFLITNVVWLHRESLWLFSCWLFLRNLHFRLGSLIFLILFDHI